MSDEEYENMFRALTKRAKDLMQDKERLIQRIDQLSMEKTQLEFQIMKLKANNETGGD